MRVRFWEEEPDAPYATLLSVIETYCHPSAWDGAYEQLRALARRTDDPEMAVFKRELIEVIHDPAVLPRDALDIAADYDDGSPESFLRRLWGDLYPLEAFPAD